MKYKCPYCKTTHNKEQWESNSKWEQEYNKEKSNINITNKNKPVRCPKCNTRVLIGELIS
jgi:DNA-directed RNA polymerase subunit RPC12/RpoP